MKVNWVKIASLGATVLSLAATLATNWSSDKAMKEAIKEEVASQMKNK